MRLTKSTVALFFVSAFLFVFVYKWKGTIPSSLNTLVKLNKEGLFESETRNATWMVGESMEGNCEVVHIVHICTGKKAPHEAVPVVQSILYNTRHPLHIHFVSDKTARQILRTQFAKWNLTRVSVTFHEGEKFKSNVSWIPTTHGSGAYGMMKLILHDILPLEVNKVILLDTDLTCMDDIYHLWKMFDKFNENQMFGLVENRNSWYFGKYEKRPWPAVGRGYNTGVLLEDLKKMRSINWNSIWKDIAQIRLRSYKTTRLGDQDIFNAVIKEHQSFVHPITCHWNLQLHINDERSVVCPGELSGIKIVHWNSGYKYMKSTEILKFFYDLRQKYMSYDMTQEKHVQCSKDKVS